MSTKLVQVPLPAGSVQARLGAMLVSSPLIFSPAPPSGASFSFNLQPESQSLVWAAPSTITAIVVLPHTKTGQNLSLQKGSSPVTFQTDRPELLAIQTQRVVGDTVKVSMNALGAGCAVLTATVDGVSWRKTLRLVTGL